MGDVCCEKLAKSTLIPRLIVDGWNVCLVFSSGNESLNPSVKFLSLRNRGKSTATWSSGRGVSRASVNWPCLKFEDAKDRQINNHSNRSAKPEVWSQRLRQHFGFASFFFMTFFVMYLTSNWILCLQEHLGCTGGWAKFSGRSLTSRVTRASNIFPLWLSGSHGNITLWHCCDSNLEETSKFNQAFQAKFPCKIPESFRGGWRFLRHQDFPIHFWLLTSWCDPRVTGGCMWSSYKVESPSSPFVPSFSYKSADGSEIHERHQSRLVVYPYLPLRHYAQGFLYIPGGNGLISEPSTVGEGHLSANLVPNTILFGSPSCPIHPPMYHPQGLQWRCKKLWHQIWGSNSLRFWGGEMMKTLGFVENVSGQGVAHLSCQPKFNWSNPNWQRSP